MSDKRRTFAVIDGNSLMHRAFHAVPPTMNAPDGRPTNAIFGFLNMFLKMIDAFNPDGVVVAFDKGKPRVRMEMLPQYKAQRTCRECLDSGRKARRSYGFAVCAKCGATFEKLSVRGKYCPKCRKKKFRKEKS